MFDDDGKRVFFFWLGFLVVMPIVLGIGLGFPFILLQYNQGPLLGDVVKIVLGFVAAIAGGAFLARRR